MARPLVLALGDSITASADWARHVPRAAVVNAGVPGDLVRDLIARLPAVVASLDGRAPDVVAVLAGTNDLGYAERDVPEVLADLRLLVEGVRAAFPAARVVLQSVMPRTRWFAERLGELNRGLETVAADLGVELHDTWPALADARGRLRRGYTRDGLHLSERGEAAWLEALGPVLTDAEAGAAGA